MKPNSEAAVYTDSVEVQELQERSGGEIDLYTQLGEFELLTPEEQARLAVDPEIEASQDNPPEVIAQLNECVSHWKDASLNVISASVAEKESTEEVEQQSVSNLDAVEEQFLGDAHAGITTIAADLDTSENESPIVTPDNKSSIDLSGNESSIVSCGIADQDDEVAMGSGNLPSDPVEAASQKIDSAATAQSNAEQHSEASEAGSGVLVRSSGPLERLDSGIEFTGTLTRGVCLACGADSSTDDLFCLACGVFIEDMT